MFWTQLAKRNTGTLIVVMATEKVGRHLQFKVSLCFSCLLWYSAMREQYMRNGEGFILVYSITSRLSFEEISTFYQQIKRVKDKDFFPMILVGNKCDLETDRQVSFQGKVQNMGWWWCSYIKPSLLCIEGNDLAKEFGCPFMETSAKQRIHVEDSFYEVVREIRRMNKREQENSRAKPGQRDQYELEKDNGGCCGCVLM